MKGTFDSTNNVLVLCFSDQPISRTGVRDWHLTVSTDAGAQSDPDPEEAPTPQIP